jgi:hypothetical protein
MKLGLAVQSPWVMELALWLEPCTMPHPPTHSHIYTGLPGLLPRAQDQRWQLSVTVILPGVCVCVCVLDLKQGCHMLRQPRLLEHVHWTDLKACLAGHNVQGKRPVVLFFYPKVGRVAGPCVNMYVTITQWPLQPLCYSNPPPPYKQLYRVQVSLLGSAPQVCLYLLLHSRTHRRVPPGAPRRRAGSGTSTRGGPGQG